MRSALKELRSYPDPGLLRLCFDCSVVQRFCGGVRHCSGLGCRNRMGNAECPGTYDGPSRNCFTIVDADAFEVGVAGAHSVPDTLAGAVSYSDALANPITGRSIELLALSQCKRKRKRISVSFSVAARRSSSP